MAAQINLDTKVTDLVKAEYRNIAVSFTEEGWFNATAVAERFGKRPIDWLRLEKTAPRINRQF